MLKKRKLWIKKKLEEEEIVVSKPKEYVNGESFSYLGRNYRLKLIQSKNIDIKLKGGYLEIYCPKILMIKKLETCCYLGMKNMHLKGQRKDRKIRKNYWCKTCFC